MRDIKFRIYNKDTGSFNYWGFDVFPYPCFSGIATGGSNTINYCRENSEQYTGLKDKNGKEIYEGDKTELLGVFYTVTFTRGAFWLLNKDFPKYPKHILLNVKTCDIEIIGNIHEPNNLG